jgi:hypothetical protein
VDDGPSRWQRAAVLGVLGLLLVGGLAEVEAWPLTAWRLFSAVRGEEQSGLDILAVDEDGGEAPVRLADLPLGYRLAGWPLGDRDGTDPTRQAICAALLEEIRSEQPGTEALRVQRTRRRLVEVDGTWRSVEVSTDLVADCARDGGP